MISLRRFFGSIAQKSNNFTRGNGKAPDTKIYAPGTRIVFDPELISRLKTDHSNLVSVYKDITRAIEHGDIKKLDALLEVFLTIFNAHALTEYTKLYVFLDYTFRTDRPNHDLVMRFRHEMNEIGKAVRQFAHAWKKTGINDKNLAEFDYQVHKIGEVLSKRIEVEENQLYQIYASAPEHFDQLGLTSH